MQAHIILSKCVSRCLIITSRTASQISPFPNPFISFLPDRDLNIRNSPSGISATLSRYHHLHYSAIMSTSLCQNTFSQDTTAEFPSHPKTTAPDNAALIRCPMAGTQLEPRHTHHRNANQPNARIFTLPNELLLKILDNLDQPALESLRRTSAIFLRALPGIYPSLFTTTFQGLLPWPVRRPWTLGVKERKELRGLLARDCPKMGGQPPPAKAVAVDLRGVLRTGESAQVVCNGRMLGLSKAWRYIPCADCGRIHPPRGLQTPSLETVKA